MIKIFLIIFLLIIAVLALDALRMYLLFQKTLQLEEGYAAFSRSVPDAKMKILVLGDSTAVGIGSERPEDSTAGRLGSLYPEAEIINRAVSGLKLEGLLTMLENMNEEKQFDIVLIQIGANDIIRLTSMQNIEERINKVLVEAKPLGKKVIFLHSGDIGTSPFFPWYTRGLLSKRSNEMREIYQKAAKDNGALYVDLLDVQSIYSKDQLHLTGEGYGLWFNEIKKQL